MTALIKNMVAMACFCVVLPIDRLQIGINWLEGVVGGGAKKAGWCPKLIPGYFTAGVEGARRTDDLVVVVV